MSQVLSLPAANTEEACAPKQEKPLQWAGLPLQLENKPNELQVEKSPRSNEDPAQAKKKKKMETLYRGSSSQNLVSPGHAEW